MNEGVMFDQQAKRLTQRLRVHDNKLYVKRGLNDVLCVYRHGWRHVKVYEKGNIKLYDLRHSPEFVLALTDNWKTNGVPREWGSEVVLERLRKMDTQRTDLFEEMDRHNDKVQESKARDFRNKTEDYLIENKGAIQKAWNDINVGTLSKREKRKEKLDKKGL